MLRELLARPEVTEVCELRSTFGIMAFHGGNLERCTDVIATELAVRTGSSLYAVVQEPPLRQHIPSTAFDPGHSAALRSFIDHVDIVIAIHGYGREDRFWDLLLGGRNRDLAAHVARHLRPRLPAYDVIDDLDRIPTELRGVHERNPVNLPRGGGVQIELPPRVRGSSPLWWDWEHGLVPHTEALIDGLAAAAESHGP